VRYVDSKLLKIPAAGKNATVWTSLNFQTEKFTAFCQYCKVGQQAGCFPDKVEILKMNFEKKLQTLAKLMHLRGSHLTADL